jgi:hypothetical protein
MLCRIFCSGMCSLREAHQLALVEAAAGVQRQDRLDEVPPLLRVELVQAADVRRALQQVIVSRASSPAMRKASPHSKISFV